ncbi:MAG: ABC transporter ATP-binding protein [Fibrobacteres bacterium]|nr:ABC transporter ATP-binding protein [Fibrobacterota bacterium]
MTDKVIETIDVKKSYKLADSEVPVLHGITFHVSKGDFVSIMGPSGSGKSTLLNILGCLDIPTSGRYLLNGRDVSTLTESELAEERNKTIGFVFQNFNLLPKLDLAANVELPLIYGNVPRKERKELVERILNRLGIWERRHHKPNEISGGQKQRTAIARALVKNPAIILADEPTGNLDSVTTSEILNLFRELHSEGNTLAIITHEIEVASVTKRQFHIRDGLLYNA